MERNAFMAIKLTEQDGGKELDVQVNGKLPHQDYQNFVPKFERLAMIGDKKWEKDMSGFCRPFTTAKIRYFEHEAQAEAREWLARS
jgi:SpoIIAA-like